ncbi:VTT domain-containing protein [Bacillus sp. FJAT-27251]|uniref:TVP38/TMEM64 family protein n=1 Tax=Bacillus sp. FJAT-27251 TaxID=1684142 RepID=UPI0006A77D30|nr:VTT domain-containing protein [Bacillus sp. FJAT-27251]
MNIKAAELFSDKIKALFNLLRTVCIYCFFLILAVLLIYWISRLTAITDAKGIESILREHMSLAKLIYFFICFAQPIVLPLPEMMTVVAGSAVLGPFSAFVLGYSGTVMGILTMFVLSRVGGMKLVRRLVKEKQIEQYHRFVQRNEVLIVALLFIIPILPDEIICVGAGISGVKARRFIPIAILSKFATNLSLAYSINLTQFFS